MHFNVKADQGGRIEAYLVPDSHAGRPRIRVADGSTELAIVDPTVEIASLVEAGRHDTGLCGFIIDERVAPDLALRADLRLTEAESGVLIYRRSHADAPARKILRVETHLLPLWRLDEALDRRFHYHARGVERLGRETVEQMFHLLNTDSVYLSGRLLLRSVMRYVEGFSMAILLQDPYREMAERLLVLARASKSGLESLGMRDSMTFRNASAFAAALPVNDERELRRALRRMPAEVAAAFANPLVRQITTNSPDEMPAQGAVAAALDQLSNFALVGVREDPEPFLDGFAELVGVDPGDLPKPPDFRSVAELAQRLRESGEVDGLLEKDRELHHYLSNAFAAASRPPEGAPPA